MERVIDCPVCYDQDRCFEDIQPDFKSYMCFNCGFMSSSYYTKDNKDKVENTSDSLHFFLPVRAMPMESPPITKGQYRIQCPILLLYFAS